MPKMLGRKAINSKKKKKERRKKRNKE